jgi:hypothetical protein
MARILASRLALPWGVVLLTLAGTSGPGLAQQKGYGQTLGSSPQERDVFDEGPGGSKDSIFDATNPLDLMNRLRRSTALDEATPPGTAVDQALKEFEAQSAPPAPKGASGSGPTRTLQGP